MLCCAILGCCVAMGLPLGHLIAHVSDLGYSITHAAMTLSVTQIFGFTSSAVLVGYFATRYGGATALILFAGVQALALALLTATQDLVLLYAISALFGIGYGGIFPAYTVIIREYMPASQAGRRAGIVFLFGASAMGLGGWLGGFLYDQTGSYTAPFLIGVAFNVVNLVIVAALIAKLPPRQTPAFA
jgi:MFS family permease